MLFKKLVLCTMLCAASCGSYAQDSSAEDTGWFVGGSIGRATSEFDSEFDVTDNSLGAYGGFNFTKWFGLEANIFTVNHDAYDIDMSIASFSVTPKFTLVLNDTVSLYAKVGLASVALIVEDDYDDEDWTGIGETLGIGAQFSITKGLKLRVSYDYTSASLESDDYPSGADVDVDIAQTALGVHYQF